MKTPILPLAFAAAIAATGTMADLPRLDSSQFDYKYEMLYLYRENLQDDNRVLPTGQDLDDDGALDFTAKEASKITKGETVNYGSIILDASSTNTYLLSNADAGSAGGAWRNSGISAANGYTVEVRLKITAVSGSAGAIVINASVDDKINAWLKFWDGSIWWGETQITSVDATRYHTYRIVREAGSNVHSVYVDGALVKSGLGDGFSYSSPLNRLLIGSPGDKYRGKAQIAFIRFHKGGYAPTVPGDKTAKKWSGEFPIQYEMAANDTRFVGATAGGTDWSGGSIDQDATVTQNGILSVTLPEAKMAYWRANDSVWRARIGSETAYTLEFAIRITDKWNLESVGDRAIQFICGNPRAAAVFYIGPNNVTWEPNGAATYTTISTGDNTDAMHTFRLTYDGATRHGYTLWRDGVVIGEYLVDSTFYNQYASAGFPNLFRWGVTSPSTVGGSFDVDYLRWTTDGAWDYDGPPKPFVMVFK